MKRNPERTNRLIDIVVILGILEIFTAGCVILSGWLSQDNLKCYEVFELAGICLGLIGFLTFAIGIYSSKCLYTYEEAEIVIIPKEDEEQIDEPIEEAEEELVEDHIGTAKYKVFTDVYTGRGKK